MTRSALVAALLAASALTGCQSGTDPAAGSAAAENRVMAENPKHQARHQQVVSAGPRVD